MQLSSLTMNPFCSIIVNTSSSLVSFEILFTTKWRTGSGAPITFSVEAPFPVITWFHFFLFLYQAQILCTCILYCMLHVPSLASVQVLPNVLLNDYVSLSTFMHFSIPPQYALEDMASCLMIAYVMTKVNSCKDEQKYVSLPPSGLYSPEGQFVVDEAVQLIPAGHCSHEVHPALEYSSTT